MDQDKIGKFITELRKEKKLTQQELANKLGVTDRAISNWENGRRLPDYSLIKDLCQELDITINELLSGERINKDNYQDKLEENIVNLAIDSKKSNQKIKIILISILILLIIFLLYRGYYAYYKIDVKYDSRLQKCEINEQQLIYKIYGTTTYETRYLERKIDNIRYFVFHDKVTVYNYKHSKWEIKESYANLVNQSNDAYKTTLEKDLNIDNEKIIVYYTDKSLKKLEKMSDIEFLKELKKSYQMCSNYD